MVDERFGLNRIRVWRFFGAAIVGGLLTGAFVGVLGALVPAVTSRTLALAVLVVLSLILLMIDLGGLRVALPQNQRQVRRDLASGNDTVADIVFGFELGTGVRTWMPGSSPYLLAILAVLLAGPADAAIAGAAFGGGRGLVAVDRSASRRPGTWDLRMVAAKSRLPVASLGLTAIISVAVVALP